jgi:hypothetical protein
MNWTILNQIETTFQQVYCDYDEEGNLIEGTDRVFDYIMVNTLIEYNFPEYNTTIQVDVAHFNPQSEDEIEVGINNRGITEQRKLTNN